MELLEAARSISISVVAGRVGLMLVGFRFLDVWTILLSIMLKLGANSTVSCANTLLKYIINNKWENLTIFIIHIQSYGSFCIYSHFMI